MKDFSIFLALIFGMGIGAFSFASIGVNNPVKGVTVDIAGLEVRDAFACMYLTQAAAKPGSLMLTGKDISNAYDFANSAMAVRKTK